MNISKEKTGTELTLVIEGKIDTTTAPQLQKEIKTSLDGVTGLVLDFAGVDYISSAGLRVLLMAQKLMSGRGTMTLRHVGADVMDIFEMTGFSDILTIES